jgi:dihydrodipicolinate synthase/N-acetylneuraminate lyase
MAALRLTVMTSATPPSNPLTDDERRELVRLLVEGARLVLAKRAAASTEEAAAQAALASASANSRNEAR